MKNILMNKKGFTLLEILVTVGIVGVLSAIAVPAYNQYRTGVTRTAIRSDAGNVQKAYMAFSAVNGTYCGSFDAVGYKTGDMRNYIKEGWIGFGDVTAGDCITNEPKLADVQWKTPGHCSGAEDASGVMSPQPTTSGTCTATGLVTSGTWTASTATFPAGCPLDVDTMILGAYTNNQKIGTTFNVNEEGKVVEKAGSACAAATEF